MTVLHINRGPGPVIELRRHSIGERWCFRCRERREFFQIMSAYDCDPMDDYYGPWPSIRCGHCRSLNADLFPGREREWEVVGV